MNPKNITGRLERFFEPFWRKIVLVIVLLILTVVLINYFQLARKSALVKNLPKHQEYEIKQVTRAMSKLVILPKGQTPKLATIISADSARKQNPQFYAQASDGDLVVIYGETAYIYNPKLKRIVNMGPVYKN